MVREVRKQDGRPDRILYSITEDGLVELERWLVQPSKPQPVRNEQLLKLFFAMPDQIGVLLEDVRLHRDQYCAVASHYDSYREQIQTLAPTPEKAKLWRLNLSLGERIQNARIEWCDEAIEVLSEMAKESDK